jgi:hypothetical protein
MRSGGVHAGWDFACPDPFKGVVKGNHKNKKTGEKRGKEKERFFFFEI